MTAMKRGCIAFMTKHDASMTARNLTQAIYDLRDNFARLLK